MGIENLSNAELLVHTKNAVHQEITATTNVVRHFREIHDRELYLELGYSSMYLMAVKEFGYDNSSAIRRTNALELSLAVPSILEKIDQGIMCLQTAADIQSFLNREKGRKKPYAKYEIEQLIDVCSGLSSRDVLFELASRNPEFHFRESKKPVSKDRLQITYTTAVSLEEKLERIKSLRSHVNPYMNREVLLDYMAEIVLDKIDPLRKAAWADEREARTAESVPRNVGNQNETYALEFHDEVVSEVGEIQLAANFDQRSAQKLSELQLSEHNHNSCERTRYVSAADDRAVKKANNGAGCRFISPISGRRCGSRHQIQRDHIKAHSAGGSNKAENLQEYCAKHNRFKWRQRAASRVKADSRAYG